MGRLDFFGFDATRHNRYGFSWANEEKLINQWNGPGNLKQCKSKAKTKRNSWKVKWVLFTFPSQMHATNNKERIYLGDGVEKEKWSDGEEEKERGF